MFLALNRTGVMKHTGAVLGYNVSVLPEKVGAQALALNLVLLTALAITIITNSLTIFVITKSPRLRVITNAFLVSLAVSDALYALFNFGTMTTTLVYFYVRFYYNNVDLENVVRFAWGTLLHSSTGNLILVSLDRWLYIVHPFLYQRFVSVKTVVVSLAFTWVSAVAVNLPYFFTLFSLKRAIYFRTLHGYVYPIIHTSSSVLVIFIYSHISIIASQQQKKISKIQPRKDEQHNKENTKSSRNFSTHAENWKAIKLLISICGLYFVFVSPSVYYLSYVQSNPLKIIELKEWNMPLLILLSIYHCSNFFVYILRIREFRKVVKYGVWKCSCCHGNRVCIESLTDRTTTIIELNSHI